MISSQTSSETPGVTPVAPIAVAPIPLSPVDHLFTGHNAYSISIILGYDQLIDSGALLQSFDQVLPQFSPLGSELVTLSDKSYGFKWKPGFAKIEIENVRELPDLENSTVLQKLLPAVESLPGKPLFYAKLIQCPDNAKNNIRSLLAISMSHEVVDGYSFFYFLTSWAKQLRGEAFIPPVHHREHLIPRSQTSGPKVTEAITKEITPAALSLRSGWTWAGSRTAPPQDLQRTPLHLTKAKLDAILSENQLSLGLMFSFNDVISAYLWKKYGVKASDPDDLLLELVCAYDFRRLDPDLSPLYFGNAVRGAQARLTAGQLRTLPLKEIAIRIKESVRSIDLAQAKDSLECLESLRQSRGLGVLSELTVVHPDRGFLVTNLSRLPVRELNFGAGSPSQIKFLTAFPSSAVILPASQADEASEGGFEIQLCPRA